MGKVMTFGASLIAAAAAGAAAMGFMASRDEAPVAAPPAASAPGALQTAQAQPRRVPASRAEAQASYAPVVQRAAPAVVNVYAQKVVQQQWRSPFADDPFFRRFFGGQFGAPRERVENSLGSGVIVRDDGVIVTNNHVVEGADQLQVVLADRREFPARLIVADPRTDIAVLRIDTGAEKLATLRFANTDNALVGDQVLAIGNPFGVGQTVTGGIISALARTDVGISDFASFIQTDAAINPGNSGGALVDMNGDLVGVNTAIFSRTGASAGVGFAVPAEMVRRVVESALAEGRVVRAWAGVRGQTVDNEMARTLGLERPGGVLIAELFPGGPLERAGLRRGDVIVGLGGREIVDENGLRFEAATKRPGEDAEVVFLRQGSRQTARVRLAAPPEMPARAETTLQGRHSFDGVRVATLNPALAEELGVDPMAKGVVVLGVDRAREGARAGFRPGDIILQVDGETVNASSDLVRLVRGAGRQGQVTLVREGRQLNAVLLL